MHSIMLGSPVMFCSGHVRRVHVQIGVLLQRWCLEACKTKANEIMSAATSVHPDALTRVVSGWDT